MLRFDKQNERGDDKPVLPNFRVFNQDGYSSSSVTESSNADPFAVYVMTSIFNGLFSRLEPVKYMMEQTEELLQHSAGGLPIFYINSAELQRITQASMFPDLENKKSDPIKNAEKKWLDKFQRSETMLKKEGKPFSHHILAWKSILSLPDYDAVYKFVSMLVVPGIGPEVYPDSEPALREEIAVQIASLSFYTEQAVRTFAEHNIKRLKKEDKPVFCSEEIAPDLSLYHYLAAEFSAFLMLAKLNTLQSIQRAFSLTLPISINGEDRVKPVFSYPISAAKDGLAEKTLLDFLKVQELYHQYAQQLGLPFIGEKLTLIDSIVPGGLCRKKENHASRSPSPSDEKKDADQNEGKGLSMKDDHHSLEEKNLLNQDVTPKSGDRFMLTSSSSSTFHHPNISEKIAGRIFQLFLKQHESSGSTSLKISYKNGITCDIVFLDKVSGAVSSVNKEGVLRMIEDAVVSVLDDDNDVLIEVSFHFQSCSYKLTAERTKPACVVMPK